MPIELRKSPFFSRAYLLDLAGRYPVFRLYFDFVRMSPSYELARMESKDELSPNHNELIPEDFESVRNTYKLVGDVKHINFEDWWIEKGNQLFDLGHNAPTVRAISPDQLNEGEQDNLQSINDSDLILILPTSLPIHVVHKRLNSIINEYEHLFLKEREIRHQEAPILVLSNRIHEEKLRRGLNLLCRTALSP
jgi:hypothetical protein